MAEDSNPRLTLWVAWQPASSCLSYKCCPPPRGDAARPLQLLAVLGLSCRVPGYSGPCEEVRRNMCGMPCSTCAGPMVSWLSITQASAGPPWVTGWRHRLAAHTMGLHHNSASAVTLLKCNSVTVLRGCRSNIHQSGSLTTGMLKFNSV